MDHLRLTCKPKIDDLKILIKATKGEISALEKELYKKPDDKALVRKIYLLEEHLKKQKSHPLLKKWIFNNATIQALLSSFQNHKGSFIQECDEISGWLQFIEQPSQAGARGEMLSLMNQGLKNYSVSRKDDSLSVDIEYAHINLIGTTQPEILKKFMKGDDGLIQRFQIVYPDYVNGPRLVDAKAPASSRIQLAGKLFELILSDPKEYAPIDQDSELGILKFDDDAYSFYVDFEARIRDFKIGASNKMISFYDKSMSFFFNLCCAYHVIEYVKGEDQVIKRNHAEMAMKSVLVFFDHIQRIYEPEEYGTDETMLASIAKMSRKIPKDRMFSKREIREKVRKFSKENFEWCFKHLIETSVIIDTGEIIEKSKSNYFRYSNKNK